jgi:hypothetical protein
MLIRQPEARLLHSAVAMLQRFRRGEPLAIMPNFFIR